MATEASPRPWRMIRAFEDEPARVIDSNDEDVAIELTDADAALIVDAVNERARSAAPRRRKSARRCRVFAPPASTAFPTRQLAANGAGRKKVAHDA